MIASTLLAFVRLPRPCSVLQFAFTQGDFVILSLQAGRLLLKVVGNRMAGNIPSGALTSSVRHLYTFDFDSVSEVAVVTKEDLLSFNWMIKAFEKRYGRQVAAACGNATAFVVAAFGFAASIALLLRSRPLLIFFQLMLHSFMSLSSFPLFLICLRLLHFAAFGIPASITGLASVSVYYGIAWLKRAQFHFVLPSLYLPTRL